MWTLRKQLYKPVTFTDFSLHLISLVSSVIRSVFPGRLPGHLHQLTPVYPLLLVLSIHLHLPFLYPLPLSVSAVIHSSPSVSPSIFTLPHFLSPFPHMWFCSPSLCIPFLHLLLFFSHPLLTYGFSLWICVWCYPEFTGAPAHMCVCFTDRDRETACVNVCRLTGLPAWACFCVCVCVLGRVQQGSGRLCNCLKCGSFRRRLNLSSWLLFFPFPWPVCRLLSWRCCFYLPKCKNVSMWGT